MKLRRIQGLDDPAARPMLALFASAFPPDEVEPIEWLEAEIEGRHPLRTEFVVAEREDTFLGFARWVRLQSAYAALGIHLAVEPAARRQGVGEALVEYVRDAEEDRALLLEVERFEDAEDDEERRVREKRLNWFRGQGATLISPTYTQPALGPLGRPVPLNLLRIGGESSLGAAYVRAVYADVYELPPDHPLVTQALAGVVG